MKRAAVAATAIVWRGDHRAGRLTRTAAGGAFEYDEAFLAEERSASDRGIAYRLPFAERRVDTRGTNIHPFFAGLLPEGIRLRALERRVKTSPDDLLSLLAAAGTDCVGDVSVTLEEPPPRATPAFEPRRAGEVSFRDLLRQSLAGERGTEPTLPGVQDKISAGVISVPVRARSGQDEFILKLNPESMPRLVENEDFFLRMAKEVGLEAAGAELVHDRDGNAGLLVRRFDRSIAGGVRRKIHQEDACQFLDRYPSDKYALSSTDIARGVAKLSSAPIAELAKLLRLYAFSYLIANGDLHAKNVSLRTVGDRIELTPAYDVLSTLPYGDRKMALKMDGRDDNLKRATFVAFGDRLGVRSRAVDAMLDELCDVAPAWMARLGEIGLDARKTADLTRVMTKRREDLGRSPGSPTKR